MMKLNGYAIVAAIAVAISMTGGAAAEEAPVAGSSDLDRSGRETMAVIDRHIAAMPTKDVETIVSDYSDDTIVIVTLFPQPIVGKDALRKAVGDVVKMSADPNAPKELKFLRKEAIGEYGYLVVDAGAAIVTETYVVRGGKVVFESATFVPKVQPAE
ncbi:hypothetical protein C100_12455 [Sphingobium sp. C100]|uniref:hypothetical protein n=1 Tax=Sphingobium sp. C100 TaxID=1207055 RepID=UPI0003D5C391|nr:hypothetical protein [Sphingobium sp. C100]ETI63480.1 hypothetical protein C100_12455 [Sphingobium sp. C100]PHQ63986.1 MAG: hypothetical protein COC10_03190 [Sphingobium sp.]